MVIVYESYGLVLAILSHMHILLVPIGPHKLRQLRAAQSLYLVLAPLKLKSHILYVTMSLFYFFCLHTSEVIVSSFVVLP